MVKVAISHDAVQKQSAASKIRAALGRGKIKPETYEEGTVKTAAKYFRKSPAQEETRYKKAPH